MRRATPPSSRRLRRLPRPRAAALRDGPHPTLPTTGCASRTTRRRSRGRRRRCAPRPPSPRRRAVGSRAPAPHNGRRACGVPHHVHGRRPVRSRGGPRATQRGPPRRRIGSPSGIRDRRLRRPGLDRRTSSGRSGTGLDVERDAWLVEVDGRVAGVAHLLEQKGGRYFGDAYVHPELTGRGVGTRLLESLEERVRELRPEWPDGERIVLEAAHLVGDERAPGALRRPGLRVRAELLPHGHRRHRAAARSRLAGRRRAATARAGPRRADALRTRRSRHSRTSGTTSCSTTTRGASGRSARAGSTLVSRRSSGRETRSSRSRGTTRSETATGGSSGRSASGRPGDRRGLGLALLRESFRRFRETGETTVALGVDVENPTGATRLYERAGHARPLAGGRLAEGAPCSRLSSPSAHRRRGTLRGSRRFSTPTPPPRVVPATRQGNASSDGSSSRISIRRATCSSPSRAGGSWATRTSPPPAPERDVVNVDLRVPPGARAHRRTTPRGSRAAGGRARRRRRAHPCARERG